MDTPTSVPQVQPTPSQYPRRWATSLDLVGCFVYPGWVLSQYPRRWATSLDRRRPSNKESFLSLNTLAGGQPLWTLTGTNKKQNRSQSQYPRRWATSLDFADSFNGEIFQEVSIPSQVGNLFGHPLTKRSVSSASGLNTLAGGQPLWTSSLAAGKSGLRRLNTLAGGQPLWTSTRSFSSRSGQVSIPSQVGNLFGLDHTWRVPSQQGSLNTLAGGQPLWTFQMRCGI